MSKFAVSASSLRTWNGVIGAVHLTSFTALSILSGIFFDQTLQVRIWTDFGGTEIQSLGAYRLFWTLLPFPLITGLIHVWIAVADADNYSRSVLQNGVNRLRWIEYAITNGLISWSVTLLAGAGSLLFPITAVLSNFVMQYFGYLHEVYNHRRTSGRSLWLIFVGFIPWAINWFIVLVYFLERVAREGASVSDWLAVIGSLVWSLAFVAPLLWRYYKPNTVENNYTMELIYILLSLSAKLWLDWVVTIGSL